jgi:hypothetical protein
VYDARLWVGPGFRQSEFDRHPLALELAYLRAFTGADIARRSIDEMRRAGSFDAAQFARLFFAIWLGPSTSEPALRQALLAGTEP